MVEGKNKSLSVYFLDVGQGDSIYIESPEKFSVLIDSGPPTSNTVLHLSKMKKFFDRKIDVLIMTHGDIDHIGNVEKIIDMYSIGHIFFNGVQSDSRPYELLLKKIEDKKIPLTIAERGMILSTESISIKFLFPDLQYHSVRFENCIKEKKSSEHGCIKKINFDQNTNSVITELLFQNDTFLFTGDAPVDVEKFILAFMSSSSMSDSDRKNEYVISDIVWNEKYQNEARSESGRWFGKQTKRASDCSFISETKKMSVLKLGHHGSKTSTSEELLRYMKPDILVVSAGLKNRYGHPSKEVIERIGSILPQSRICTTASGTIMFSIPVE